MINIGDSSRMAKTNNSLMMMMTEVGDSSWMTVMKIGDSSKVVKPGDREDNAEGWGLFQDDDDEG